ncbi:hypothetical protein GGI43DRAFT_417600 [Trichoderma evansii]
MAWRALWLLLCFSCFRLWLSKPQVVSPRSGFRAVQSRCTIEAPARTKGGGAAREKQNRTEHDLYFPFFFF